MSQGLLGQASAAAILKHSLIYMYLFMFLASIKSPALWTGTNKFLDYLFKACYSGLLSILTKLQNRKQIIKQQKKWSLLNI